jgi:hypothetical protein
VRTYVAELTEVSLNFVIADLGDESSNEDLSGASLGFLGVNLLVVDDVITGSDNLVDGVGCLVDDESESARAPSGWVCLDVDALNFSVLAEVIAEFL